MGVQGGGMGIRNWGRHNLLHGYNHFFQNLCRVNSMSGLFDDGIETGVFVSGVVYGAGGAIRFNQLVVAFNFIAFSFLSLFLDVSSVIIFYSILELVMRRSLKVVETILLGSKSDEERK
jgi:hypothetical protein